MKIAIVIYNLSIQEFHQLLGEWLAEFAAVLDSFFTGVANTSSTPTGWEVGWRAGSHESK